MKHEIEQYASLHMRTTYGALKHRCAIVIVTQLCDDNSTV